MKKIRLGAGIFILRKEAERDLFSVLEKVGAIGYEGVELIGFFGKDPREIRKKLSSLNMEAIGSHVSAADFLKDTDKVIRDHLEVGCGHITIGWPDRNVAPNTREFEETAKQVKYLSEVCQKAGITPLYHNHDYEFNTSPSSVELLLEICREEQLCFEPDVGWMAFKNIDPIPYLVRYKERIPVIHLKDIYADDITKVGAGNEGFDTKGDPEKGGFEFRPTGYGMVNMPLLMPYCLKCNPKWLMVDHDHFYDRDSYGDLALSFRYVKDLLNLICPEDQV